MTEDLGVNELKANPPYIPQLGCSQSALPKGGKKVAFTLAEVLVTLGIIGVVAAMTLPMLAENYQRIVVQTRLKKFYTTFNQAILRAIEHHGPYSGWVYEIDHYDPVAFRTTFDYYLRPYLNVIQTQDVIYTDGKSATLYYLADGSAFMYLYTHNRDIYYFPKNPVKCLQQSAINRYGVCRFDFNFAPKSSVIGPETVQLRHVSGQGMEAYSYGWDGKPESLYYSSNNQGGCNQNGAYCTMLIKQNSWEFPKDYPRKICY
ncbi:type II secretion system protein [bacterium]|nr:type II secretion system protein [bacterium]